jgi:uncharacterized membrane protein YphA (DoxX/SURF4 family)
MKKRTFIEIIALWFVILFLYTGISKLMDYPVFAEQIAMSPILEPVASWIAWMLPLSEFLAAILLFIPQWRRKGMYAAFLLMVFFTFYVGAILIYNDHLPCSCGGVIELLSWKGHLVFNNICVGLALTGIVLQRSLKSNASHKQSINENLLNTH